MPMYTANTKEVNNHKSQHMFYYGLTSPKVSFSKSLTHLL